jgi:hypothetical protein
VNGEACCVFGFSLLSSILFICRFCSSFMNKLSTLLSSFESKEGPEEGGGEIDGQVREETGPGREKCGVWSGTSNVGHW